MTKQTLLYVENNPGLPNQWHWRNHLSQYFNFEVLDMNKTYDPKECFMWMCRLEEDQGWAQQYIDKGFKLVYENLWDYYGKAITRGSTLMLHSHDFILADESLMYTARSHDKLDVVRTNPRKFLFCPMHLEREHRTQLFDKIKKYQDVSLISYVSKGITLPGDIEYGDGRWQRFANPEWYKSTNFSLVAETTVIDPMLISEKMFKPSAFKHPFIIFGPPFVLERLQSYGFETFSHVVDESYSRITNEDKRLVKISNIIDELYTSFQKGDMLFSDTRSLEIIDHNYATFYNKELINNIVVNDIVNPVLEFVNKI